MVLKISEKESKKLICSLIHRSMYLKFFYESLKLKSLIECYYVFVCFVSLSIFIECNRRRVFSFAIFVSDDRS